MLPSYGDRMYVDGCYQIVDQMKGEDNSKNISSVAPSCKVK